MLQFLSSLFSTPEQQPARVDEALMERATERVVEGTDKRLRAYGNYRKALHRPVEAAVVHVIDLIDALPQPTEISRETFASDPRLHAFFGSFARLQEKVTVARNVRDYVEHAGLGASDQVYGLLSMERKETKKTGAAMHGDMIQRDVIQTSVKFFNHHFAGVTNSLEESGIELKKMAFDYLIERALEGIVSARTQRAELQQEHRLLERKLAAMRAGNWGLGEVMTKDADPHPDLDSLSAEIDSLETEMSKLGDSQEVLGRNMDIVRDTLGRPDRLLSIRNVTVSLDRMNTKLDDTASGNVNTFDLIELFSDNGETRTVLPGWYRVGELPPRRDFFKEANRYLGK
jgi:hypothetical protein